MLYSNTIERIKRNSDSEIFFLTIKAVPDRKNPQEDAMSGIQGAYVNCYINADSLCEAEERAVDLIREVDWHPITLLRWQILCKGCYPELGAPDFEELSASMDEAFSFGNSMIFYQWSQEDEEDDGKENDSEITFAYCQLMKR
ncbi:MAG: hypothetical protein C5B47_02135 [Verrucomicrobia bacterium]|nr:MAG: hypothetical protein C5B47_02135 [Verrucomicrobiota bacterium]